MNKAKTQRGLKDPAIQTAAGGPFGASVPDKDRFSAALITQAENAMDLIANVLQASTEYSIIGKDLDGTIVLWNEGARRLDRR